MVNKKRATMDEMVSFRIKKEHFEEVKAAAELLVVPYATFYRMAVVEKARQVMRDHARKQKEGSSV